jgi:hypothetical protein
MFLAGAGMLAALTGLAPGLSLLSVGLVVLTLWLVTPWASADWWRPRRRRGRHRA